MDVKPLAWTPEHVARFWNYWSQRRDGHATYFAYQVGKGVCRFLKQLRPLADQDVLDYGAGPGYLVDQLLRDGANVSAVEYSPDCVTELNERFKRERGFGEARLYGGDRLPWNDDSFDTVCCLETIEHVLSEHIDDVFSELLRVVRPGGVILLTTPNSEDLKSQTVFCPNCCSEFHRWQHVRRWTPETLQRRLTSVGYDVVFCRGISFHDFQAPWPRPGDLLSVRKWRRQIANGIAIARDRFTPVPFPDGHLLKRRLRRSSQHHLVAVARKPIARAASAPGHRVDHGATEPLLFHRAAQRTPRVGNVATTPCTTKR